MEHATKTTTLKYLKAKITHLHHYKQQRIFLDNDERDVMVGEQPSLYHYIRAKTQRDARIVSDIQDSTGVTHTTTVNILRTFTESLRAKYENIPVDDDSIRILMTNINKTQPPEANLALDAPITIDVLQLAVKKGKTNKAPSSGGMNQDVFKFTLDIN